jgi:hypothetical protein
MRCKTILIVAKARGGSVDEADITLRGDLKKEDVPHDQGENGRDQKQRDITP